MSWFRKPSSTPLWRDEFSVHHGRRTLCEPPAVHQVPDADQLRHVGRELCGSSRDRHSTARPTYPRVAVAAADEIAVGGVKIFAYPTADDPCILVRTE